MTGDWFRIMFRVQITFVILMSLIVGIVPQSAVAANPPTPILPSDNVQDPGSGTNVPGGLPCSPLDSNCFVTSSSASSTILTTLQVTGTTTLSGTTTLATTGITALTASSAVVTNATFTNATSSNFFSSILSALTATFNNLLVHNTSTSSVVVATTSLISQGTSTLSTTTVNGLFTTNYFTNLATTSVAGDLSATGLMSITGQIIGNDGLQITGTTSLSGTTTATGPFETAVLHVIGEATTTGLIFTNATGTNATITNLFVSGEFTANNGLTGANATFTNATSSNFFSTLLNAVTSTFTNLFATNATTTNLNFTNASGTNATTTNLFSTNASLTNATATNLFASSLQIDSLNGVLHAVSGLVNATSTLSAIFGGTGNSAYAVGDILYASNAGTLTKLGIGGVNEVLKVVGGVPSWEEDATGFGAFLWASSTDNLQVHPSDPTDVVVIGGVSTTTLGNILEVLGQAYFSSQVLIGTSSSPGNALGVNGDGLFNGDVTADNLNLSGGATTTSIAISGLASSSALITSNATITNATISNLYVNGNLTLTGGGLSLSEATITNSTSTNLFSTNASLTNATVTNLVFTNATGGSATTSNFFSTVFNTLFGSSTNFLFTNATGTNATITNFFATNGSITNATSTNFFASILNALTASFTDLFATNATLTNSTSTNIAISNQLTNTGTTSLATTTVTGPLTLTSYLQGRLLFPTTTGEVVQDDALFWNEITNALGIGTLTPGASLDINQGVLAAAVPAFMITSTWNNVADSFDAIYVDVTDTASAPGSRLIDLMVGGVSMFSVDKFGTTTVNGNLNVVGTTTLSNVLDVGSNKIINVLTPTNANDAVNKTYVDSLLFGLSWLQPVIDIASSSAPGAPTTGDRYLLQAGHSGFGACVTHDIVEWNGASWVCTTPSVGNTVYADNTTNTQFTFSSTTNTWVSIGSQINHGSLSGLQGGTAGEYYHLTQSQYDAVNDVNAQLLQLQTDGSPTFVDLTLTGELLAGNGSAAAPSHSFSTDTDTGMYRAGIDQLGFATGGTLRVTIDAAGRLGIGNATPAFALDVVGDGFFTGNVYANNFVASGTATTTNFVFTNATGTILTTNLSSTTGLIFTNATGTNATITNLYGVNASLTNATATNLFAAVFDSLLATITDLIATNATATNFFATNSTTTNATATNFFAGNASATNLTALNATTTNLIATNSTTSNATITNLAVTGSFTGPGGSFTNGTFTNATITNLYADNASVTNSTSTNLFSTNASLTNATITNLVFTNATGGAATTTNFFSTVLNAVTSTITNLFATNATTTNSTSTNSFISNLVASLGTFTNLFATNATFTNATTSNLVTSNITIGALNGPLQAVNGAVSATNTISAAYGGTGHSTFAIGDILYADTASSLARLPIGGVGQVLSVVAGLPAWGNGSNNSPWGTTTDSLAIAPLDVTDVVLVGTGATSTTGYIMEIVGNVLLSGLLNVSDLLFTNATGTNATTTNFATTDLDSANASISGVATTSGLIFTNATGTNATVTNLFAANASISNATMTNLFATNGVLTNSTTTNATITTLAVTNLNLTGGASSTNGTFTNSTTTNLFATNASMTNATTVNFFSNNASITNSTSTNLFASILTALTATFTDLFFTNASGTNSTSTNLVFVNATGTNATTTNLFSTLSSFVTAFITNLTATNSTTTNATTSNFASTNINATGTATTSGLIFTNATGTNATITNLFVSGALTATNGLSSANATFTNATITNLQTTNSTTTNIAFTNASGSNATTTNLVFVNATGTNATTSNFFSTLLSALTANFTNLFATNATLTNATATTLSIGALTGPLQAINGVVSATGTMSAAYGGTGFSSFTIGDILYADSTGSLARLGIGGVGQVLKVAGGVPTWAADATGGSGSGAFSTSTDNLSVYTTIPGAVVIIGASATSTTGNILEIVGNTLQNGTFTLTNIVATGTATLANAVITNSTTTNATITTAVITNASTTGLTVYGTSTLGGPIVGTSSATSTLAGGINITGGCFSIMGSCISAGGANFSQLGNAFGALAVLGTNDTFGLAFETDGVERARFDTSGNFGIGTTTPSSNLAVQGNTIISGNITSVANINATGTATTSGLIFTNATGTNATITNLSTTNFFASVFSALSAAFTNLTATNGTITNATSSNLFGGTITGNTASFGSTATSSFSSSGQLTLAGSLNGPLQANNGVVSATTSVGVLYGGTGLTSAPAFGNIMVGNASGGYTLTATSSLGLDASFYQQNGNSFGALATLGTNDANSLAFETGGTERMRIDTNGNVGIGTTSPSGTLAISGSSASELKQLVLQNTGAGGQSIELQNSVGATGSKYLWDNNNSNAWLYSGASANLIFGSNGQTERMRITSAGNVGIGSTSPYSTLGVSGNAVAANWYTNSGSADAGTTGFATGVGPAIQYWGTASVNAGSLILTTAGTEKMRIINGGNIGVGTSTPAVRMEVVGGGGTGGLAIAGTVSGTPYANASVIDNSTGDMRVIAVGDSITKGSFSFVNTFSNSVGFTTAMKITSTGSVGIGTTSPATTLALSGTTGLFASTTGTSTFQGGGINLITAAGNTGCFAVNGVCLTSATTAFVQNGNSFGALATLGTNDANSLAFETGGTERLRIDTSGNVGIGAVPAFPTRLTVVGAAGEVVATPYGNSQLTITNQGEAGISIHGASGSASRIFFGTTGVSGNTMGRIEYNNNSTGSSGSMAFVTDNSERVRITGTGNVGIGTTTPQWLLNPTSASASQLVLSAGAGVSQWAFRNAGGNFYLASTTLAGTATSTISALSIVNNGNVGLGVNNAKTSLQVTSTSSPAAVPALGAAGSNSFYVTNADVNYGLLAGSLTSGNSFLQVQRTDGTATAYDLLLQPSGGNIGIGDSTPLYRLDVAGTIGINSVPFADHNGNYNRVFEPAGNPAIYLGNATDPTNYYDNTSHIWRNRGGTQYGAFDSGGDFGVGTVAPARRLEVFHTAAAPQILISYDATRFATLQVDSVGDLFIASQAGNVRMNSENLFVCTGGSCPAGTPSGQGNIIAETSIGIASSSPSVGLAIAAGKAIVVNENTLATSTSFTVDWRNGNQQLVRTGTAATTISFSNFQHGQKLVLVVCNPNAVAGAITWGTTIFWPGGTAPTQTTTANKCDVWSFLATNGTSTIRIFGAQNANF